MKNYKSKPIFLYIVTIKQQVNINVFSETESITNVEMLFYEDGVKRNCAILVLQKSVTTDM